MASAKKKGKGKKESHYAHIVPNLHKGSESNQIQINFAKTSFQSQKEATTKKKHTTEATNTQRASANENLLLGASGARINNNIKPSLDTPRAFISNQQREANERKKKCTNSSSNNLRRVEKKEKKTPLRHGEVAAGNGMVSV